jgi:hypothetical protein
VVDQVLRFYNFFFSHFFFPPLSVGEPYEKFHQFGEYSRTTYIYKCLEVAGEICDDSRQCENQEYDVEYVSDFIGIHGYC